MKKVNRKTNVDIALEWDQVSEVRFQQIRDNKDLSFKHILKPCILELINPCNKEKVLDIGCGTGNLTSYLANYSDEIIGIDLSGKSIEVAAENFQRENMSFQNYSIEQFAKFNNESTYSLVVANMVLMDVAELSTVIKSIKDIIKNNGHFVFTITHPCYWPVYWEYFDEKWFNYKEELYIESPFKIATEKVKHRTTHIHRSLEQYVNTLCSEGFIIEKMIEPIPNEEVLTVFPENNSYPRFMGIRCKLL